MSTKLVDALRNLWSDAKPRPPRNENLDTSNTPSENDSNNDQNRFDEEQEEIIIEPEDVKKEKPKFKHFFGPKQDKKPQYNNNPKQNKNGSHVNTQATGNVVNIIGSSNVHWGNEFVYYMGPTHNNPKDGTYKNGTDEENIKKDNLITLLMESSKLLEHEYIDYISKNLGKNWHSFFRSLGFTKGRIETVEIDEARNGVSEARYKLLLDWSRNAEDGSLGRIASLLWDEGERSIVKELSIIYSKNK